MTTSEADHVYLARDVYREWKRRVSHAGQSISVYTPYFDRLLLYLIAASSVPASQITIITNLDPALLLEMPSKLRIIKKALSSGVCVRSLDGLHAKALLVDDEHVTLGSQNFTFRGRKNKEATAVPSDSLAGTVFVDTLIEWREQADTVDEELIDLLLAQLPRRIRQHRTLLRDTRRELDDLMTRFERVKQDRLMQELRELARLSGIQIGHGQVEASIQLVRGVWEYYYSLLAEGDDLTQWKVRSRDGSLEPYRLSRLSIYPMLVADSLRMGFARIGRTRITYVRNSLHWTTRWLEVGDMLLDVQIAFPQTKTRTRNITVTLTGGWDTSSCEFDLLFTGGSVIMVAKRYKGDPDPDSDHGDFVSTLETHFFASPGWLERFFARYFTHFTFKELGRGNKNITDYLNGHRYRLTVIEYAGNPFLIAAKV